MRVFIFLTLAVVAVYGKGYGYGGHGHGHWHHHKMPFGPGPGFGSFGAMGGAGSVGIGGKSFVDFGGPAGFGPRMMPPPPPPPMPTFEMSSGYLPPPPPSGPLLPPGPPPPGPGPMYDFGGYQEIYPPMGPQYYDTGYYYSQPGPGIGGTAGIQMAPEPVPLQTAAVQPPPTNFLAQPQVFPNAPMGGAGAVQSNFIGGGQPADAGLFTAQNGMLPAAPPLAGQAFGAPGAFPGINQINGAGAALSQQLPGAQTMNVMNAINKKK